MDIILRIIAFIGTIVSLGCAIFVLVSNLKIRKMRNVNRDLGVYIKSKEFLLMKNDGENPCETRKKFGMPLFSQESDYIIRRDTL